MKKLISLLLALALLVLCCGCAASNPDGTEPSGGEQVGGGESTDSTKPEETEPTESTDPTQPTGPVELEYTWEQINYYTQYYYDQYGVLEYVSVFGSTEDLQQSRYKNWGFAESYDETFFETKTLLVVNCEWSPPVGHRAAGLIQNPDGSYLLTIERLTPEFVSGVTFGTTVIIEVDALIDPNAEIEIETIHTIVPGDHEDLCDFPDDFIK